MSNGVFNENNYPSTQLSEQELTNKKQLCITTLYLFNFLLPLLAPLDKQLHACRALIRSKISIM